MKNLILTLILLCPLVTFSQSPCKSDICVVQFNANWNEANDVEWADDLSDCGIKYIDIATDADAATDYGIVVVPTIVVFNGKEVKRFQADISFTMKATKKDVQAVIDEILMDSF